MGKDISFSLMRLREKFPDTLMRNCYDTSDNPGPYYRDFLEAFSWDHNAFVEAMVDNMLEEYQPRARWVLAAAGPYDAYMLRLERLMDRFEKAVLGE